MEVIILIVLLVIISLCSESKFGSALVAIGVIAVGLLLISWITGVLYLFYGSSDFYADRLRRAAGTCVLSNLVPVCGVVLRFGLAGTSLCSPW